MSIDGNRAGKFCHSGRADFDKRWTFTAKLSPLPGVPRIRNGADRPRFQEGFSLIS